MGIGVLTFFAGIGVENKAEQSEQRILRIGREKGYISLKFNFDSDSASLCLVKKF